VFALIALTLTLALSGSAFAEERLLTQQFLEDDTRITSPVTMSEFAPSADAEPASQVFDATLRLDAETQAGLFELIQDDWGRAVDRNNAVQFLPEIEIAFVQHGDDLIPVVQTVRRGNHPYWELVVRPGKVWDEPDEAQWSRAAVPFALQERSANCTHNGVLTWLFDGEGNVSRAFYQISSETCAYLKFNQWGTIDASAHDGPSADESRMVVDRHVAHIASRLPVQPLERLNASYPGIDTERLGFDDGISSSAMTVHGMVVDGVHYQGGCRTRHGMYPYCDSLPLPSYSTAKSIFAALAVMRMEKLSPGTSQVSLGALIEPCTAKGWQDVTIENALDMATGYYTTRRFNKDEDSPDQVGFVYNDNHTEKLEFACNHYKRKSKPGRRWVYHTSDTYLVGVALQQILGRIRPGLNDIYADLISSDIWDRLRLSPLLQVSKRTYDEARQPFAGYGLTYEADDIVRIALWLMTGSGQIDGREIIDRNMLDAALQRDKNDRGLKTGAADLRYNNGFWAYDVGPVLGCESEVWVPFMSGFGGITIVMFPNGVVYYYFSDSYVFSWKSAIVASNLIGEMCG